MPLVSVRSSPNGLPIAEVGSPTWTVGRVAERERLGDGDAVQIDLEQGEVVVRVLPHDRGLADHVVLELRPSRRCCGSAPSTTW